MGSIAFEEWLKSKRDPFDEQWAAIFAKMRIQIEEAAWEGWKGKAAQNVKEAGRTDSQQLKAEILPLIEQAIGEINGGTFADAISPLELAAAKLSAV